MDNASLIISEGYHFDGDTFPCHNNVLRQISDKAASEQASALVTWRRWLAA